MKWRWTPSAVWSVSARETRAENPTLMNMSSNPPATPYKHFQHQTPLTVHSTSLKSCISERKGNKMRERGGACLIWGGAWFQSSAYERHSHEKCLIRADRDWDWTLSSDKSSHAEDYAEIHSNTHLRRYTLLNTELLLRLCWSLQASWAAMWFVGDIKVLLFQYVFIRGS